MTLSSYIGYHFKVRPLEPGVEILMAELGSAGFESFVETEDGLDAYIQNADWKEDILADIRILSSDDFEISYRSEEIAQTNWNETWERNFHPIVVDDECTIRAPFHPKTSTPYDIVIEPKMSFGTGHHETTHMMIHYLLNQELTDKTVLDMGCGTGVLAILAEERGATKIDAIDIDSWAFENSLENIQRNNCNRISVYQGDATLLEDRQYDIIIANINRNILLQDMRQYVNSLNDKGVILLSGFYEADIPLLQELCNSLMLKLEETIKRGEWVALKFIN